MVKRTYLVFLLAAVVLFSGCVFSGRDKTAIEQNLAAMGAADSIEDVESLSAIRLGLRSTLPTTASSCFRLKASTAKIICLTL